MAAAQLAGRASGSSSSAWWLTLVVRDTCCARCGGVLRVGREMVYRHTPREARCAPHVAIPTPQYGPARRRGGNGTDPALDRSARHHAEGI